jgi:hypothetical protein
MPEFRVWLKELDSHRSESAFNGLNVGDNAEFLLPSFCLEKAESLAFSNRFP